MSKPLTMEEIQDFIKKVRHAMNEQFFSRDGQLAVLMSMVKISEEVGELSDAVLHYMKQQRPDKILPEVDQHVADELADVILSTVMLAQDMQIDVTMALQRKMLVIKSRFKID